jgi:hypothetical protein
VRARVDELQERVKAAANAKFDITAERVLQELAAIAFAKPGDYYESGTNLRPRFNKAGEPIIDPATGQQEVDHIPSREAGDRQAVAKPFSYTKDQIAALRVLSGPARHVMLYGGSRSGKTFVLCSAIIHRALGCQCCSPLTLFFFALTCFLSMPLQRLGYLRIQFLDQGAE